MHFEVLTLNRGVRFQRVEDFEHVGSHYIKRIIIEPDLEALSPFLLLTQAYQVATQQRMTLPVFRISLNAGARIALPPRTDNYFRSCLRYAPEIQRCRG